MGKHADQSGLHAGCQVRQRNLGILNTESLEWIKLNPGAEVSDSLTGELSMSGRQQLQGATLLTLAKLGVPGLSSMSINRQRWAGFR